MKPVYPAVPIENVLTERPAGEAIVIRNAAPQDLAAEMIKLAMGGFLKAYHADLYHDCVMIEREWPAIIRRLGAEIDLPMHIGYWVLRDTGTHLCFSDRRYYETICRVWSWDTTAKHYKLFIERTQTNMLIVYMQPETPQGPEGKE